MFIRQVAVSVERVAVDADGIELVGLKVEGPTAAELTDALQGVLAGFMSTYAVRAGDEDADAHAADRDLDGQDGRPDESGPTPPDALDALDALAADQGPEVAGPLPVPGYSPVPPSDLPGSPGVPVSGVYGSPRPPYESTFRTGDPLA